MDTRKSRMTRNTVLPNWVPKEALRYLSHVENGNSIREIARRGGCAPSTVMRQLRKIEEQRDDPLIDEALSSLSQSAAHRSADSADDGSGAVPPSAAPFARPPDAGDTGETGDMKETGHRASHSDRAPDLPEAGSNAVPSSGSISGPTAAAPSEPTADPSAGMRPDAAQGRKAPQPPQKGGLKDRSEVSGTMTDHTPFENSAVAPPDDATVAREARRILRRLSEPGACLAVARDMEKAVVVRDLSDGRTTRTAILDRAVAQAMALKSWIRAQVKGQITRYTITAAGRTALRQFLAEDAAACGGFAEAPVQFVRAEGGAKLPGLSDRRAGAGDAPDMFDGAKAQALGTSVKPSRRIRYATAETPVMMLARRRDKSGAAFLSPDLVAAAEKLREDFELAQMGTHVTRNWDQFLTGRVQVSDIGNVHGFGIEPALARVAAALADLGPGLGDAALRCCCYLEGMEQAEKRLGWSARSGKIVLRIALQRLKRHYDQAGYSNLIG